MYKRLFYDPAMAKSKNVEKVETRGRPAVSEDTQLTPKQWQFAEIVATQGEFMTLRDCAVEAGFASSGSHTRAYEMLNPKRSPHIVKALAERRRELAKKYEVTYERHIKDLLDLRQQCVDNGAWSAAVQAEKLRGYASGDIYVSKSEVRHGSIDSMSKAEVEKELARLKEQMEGKVVAEIPKREQVLEKTEIAH